MVLTTAVTKSIDDQAMQLLERVFGSLASVKVPVDLDKILDYAGLTVKEGDFGDANVSGAFDRASKTIYISRSEPYERKSFTIGHELGHYKLHDDVSTDIFYRQQVRQLITPEADQRETEASWFAASLLMPKEHVEDLWKITKDVEQLAQIFGVSPVAMSYRLRNLELLK